MDELSFKSRLDELAEIVAKIPYGMCASYGSVGRAMTRPVSGFLAGKWMASLPTPPSGEMSPWWRVVKTDGTIALFDRDPELGLDQTRRLLAEGVPFLPDGRVDMDAARFQFLD